MYTQLCLNTAQSVLCFRAPEYMLQRFIQGGSFVLSGQILVKEEGACYPLHAWPRNLSWNGARSTAPAYTQQRRV